MRVAQHLAGGGNVGRVQFARRSANAFTVASSRITKSSTLSQKLRVGGGGPQRLRADSALGQKQAQPLGVAGNEGQRLNCNDFSYFPGVVNRLFQRTGLPFR